MSATAEGPRHYRRDDWLTYARAPHATCGMQHPDGRVLVVMHSTLMRLLICHLLVFDLDRYRALFPGVTNAALTAFTLTPGTDPQLMAFNVPTDTRAPRLILLHLDRQWAPGCDAQFAARTRC
ncbi:histidine phosphatase family protein [Microbacterium sp. MPKO10]|uniref:histidine phosphatase family protein n=1 Tax=Microbacterium sp. MPKO10 TaxID=2989818 RepID=UPI002236A76C|nr:histidine phosphatase family protein [Microbacterium sp. MPKO10]MCW4459943.1 histidine phosphatase family protein [Microbacterium sp. MPKO10]